MKAEEKQALIKECKEEIESIKFRISRTVGVHGSIVYLESCLKRQEIALAALTAQPVKLPKSERLDGNGYGYYFDMDDVFVAMESAGVKFEVQK